MKIAIGIPAYNEEKNLPSLIIQLKKKFNEIIVCDDGSTDQTKEIAEKIGAVVVSHSKNLGYGSAIKSIFLKAKEINADILVTFDADGQHRIEDIETVLRPILNNEADIVIGSRFLGNPQNIPKYRKFGIKAITGLTNISTGTKISDAQSGFRGYNKQVLSEIIPSDSGMGISTEILIKSSKKQFKISEVPITIKYEGDTSTHNPVYHGTSVILSTLKYTAIDRPLTFYGIPGLLLFVIGLIFGGWTLHLFSELGRVVTNLALVSIAGLVLGTTLLITATLLYSMVSLIREKS